MAMPQQTTPVVWTPYSGGDQPAVVPSSGQMQPLVMDVRPISYIDNYKSGQSLGLGITLVIVGALSIVFNIVDMVLPAGDEWGEFWSWGFIGHGIWAGVMCVIAGSFGIAAARTKTKCTISAFMVLSIIAAATCLGQLAAATLAVSVMRQEHYDEDCKSRDNDRCTSLKTHIAMESLLLFLGLVGGAFAIWGSVICCSATCCAVPQQTTTVASATHLDGAQAVQPLTIPSSGQMQPAAMDVRPITYIDKYKSGQSLGLGITLITAGALSIVFNMVIFVKLLPWSALGYGFWNGVMCIIAGSFGIAAARSKSKCAIIAFMVLSIISAVTCLGQLSLAALGIDGEISSASDIYDCEMQGFKWCDFYQTHLAMESLLIILAIVGGIAAIWGSVICCKATCCGARNTPSAGLIQAGVPITVVNQQGQMMPHVPYAGPADSYSYQIQANQPQFAGYDQQPTSSSVDTTLVHIDQLEPPPKYQY